eukprot:836399-Lingulodinium_polyedra.AAC.1
MANETCNNLPTSPGSSWGGAQGSDRARPAGRGESGAGPFPRRVCQPAGPDGTGHEHQTRRRC